MATSTPRSWRALQQENINLDDILGTPEVDAERVAADFGRSVGAFGAADAVGLPSGLQVMVRRQVHFRPSESGTSLRASAANAAQVVDDALGEQKVRAVHRLTSWTGTHQVLQQQLRGRDVVGGRILVHADAQGAYGMTGHPLGDLAGRDPGPAPRLRRQKVEGALHEQLAVAGGARPGIRAVVLPHSGGAQWAWFAKVRVAEPFADVHVFLDTEELRPLLMYPTSAAAAYGEARLYPVSPTRTPDRTPVCLRELGDGPPGGLRGARVEVSTDLGDAVLRSDRLYDFADDEPELDEASAFHHAGEALRWFGQLFRPELFASEIFQPLRLVVHHQKSAGNAYFHPDRGMITLGDWPAGPTAARSADVVVHEIGHAVTHGVAKLAASVTEQALGIGEGYSDYFACSMLDDPRFGDYVTGKADGHRSCAKPELILSATDGVDRYGVGEVLANALWDFREAVGPTIADLVVAESLYFAQTVATVQEALAALQAAEASLFPSSSPGRGRHAEQLETAFTARFG
jgi:hypothetical protein